MSLMEDIGLFNQSWKWVHWKKNGYSVVKAKASCCRDEIGIFVERYWPMVVHGCTKLWTLVLFSLLYWKNCFMRGTRSFLGLDSAALLVIMWSCFLSLTSISCLMYVFLSMGTAGVAIQYVGYTPGLFIAGLFGILILWMYANFWIIGTLFIVGGCLFSFKHARLIVLMATMYAFYCVKTRAGWVGIFLSINMAFLSHDLFKYLLQWCDNLCETTHIEVEQQQTEPSESFTEDDYTTEFKSSSPSDEAEKAPPFKVPDKPVSSTCLVDKPKEMDIKEPVKDDDANSLSEMERILSCNNYYEALGFSRSKSIDVVLLKKVYRKKAMLVHPDKNMGSPVASESFKKLQCAYEVLSDVVKKSDYDDILRKEESRSVTNRSPSTSRQDDSEFCLEESRKIQCTKCGNSHIWVCTKRTTSKARWCQDCCQFHQAKDGDGWVEYKGSLVFDQPRSQSVEIPRAFVCAESKIFDVSEWAICQGMECRPNTHRPSFHVNMVGMDNKSCERSKSSRYPWDMYDEMMEEDVEFELWLQEAVASGLFCESSKRRKSWGPFKLPQTKGLKQWRRSS